MYLGGLPLLPRTVVATENPCVPSSQGEEHLPRGQVCGPVGGGLSCVPHILTPVPYNVALLGNRVVADVMS